jgi:hypothetical protein
MIMRTTIAPNFIPMQISRTSLVTEDYGAQRKGEYKNGSLIQAAP